MALTFGSLFAGVGGFDLGFERAGMECRWQVEIDDYANRVLEKHWPNVRRWRDVRTFPQPGFERVDVICGGFPCQDISYAGRGAGLEGERSGLFFEAIRVVQQLRPRVVVLENVAALLTRGLDRVLGELAEIGFDAEWQTISAQMLGAPHGRERIFIVAYPAGERCEANEFFSRRPLKTTSEKQAARIRSWPGECQSSAAFANRVRWVPNSEFCRVANELPDELDRYRCLGNAIVPQVAEYIGRRIIESLNP